MCVVLPNRAENRVLMIDFVRNCQSRFLCGNIEIGNFVQKRQPSSEMHRRENGTLPQKRYCKYVRGVAKLCQK